MRIARETEERRHLREAYRPPTWQGWLEVRAAEGNAEALATLSTMRRSAKPAAPEKQNRDAAREQSQRQPRREQQRQNEAEHER